MNVLLIGKRAKILDDVAGRLRGLGHQVTLTNDLDMEQLKSIDVSQMDAVAYGRALTPEQKASLTKLYRQKNASLSIVEGWAPIPELIASQILSSSIAIPGLEVSGTTVTTQQDMRVHVKGYRLNWLYRVKLREADLILKAGAPTDIAASVTGSRYFVLESDGRYCTLK